MLATPHYKMEIYEVAVVGAGVEGSATAYYLTSRGTRPVLLLEQVRRKVRYQNYDDESSGRHASSMLYTLEEALMVGPASRAKLTTSPTTWS